MNLIDRSLQRNRQVRNPESKERKVSAFRVQFELNIKQIISIWWSIAFHTFVNLFAYHTGDAALLHYGIDIFLSNLDIHTA